MQGHKMKSTSEGLKKQYGGEQIREGDKPYKSSYQTEEEDINPGIQIQKS